MRKLGEDIPGVLRRMGGDSGSARLNMRVREVLERYRQAIESVYPERTARLHLEHTNKVIIKDAKTVGRDGEALAVRTLIVYVDESLFAAELNAQRELVKLKLLELFGEEVEDFEIRISGKREYKQVHPYIDDEVTAHSEQPPSAPLDAAERAFVSRTVSAIEDEKLRASLEKAMTTDMEWKKGENMERERKNTK